MDHSLIGIARFLHVRPQRRLVGAICSGRSNDCSENGSKYGSKNGSMHGSNNGIMHGSKNGSKCS